MMRIGRSATVLLLLTAAVALAVSAQVPLQDYERALYSIPVFNPDFMLSTIELAMTQEDFPAEPLLSFIERLADHPGEPFEKDAILMVLAHAMEVGLPIEGLVSKAFEGLARRIPLHQLESWLSQRMVLLAETRDLLYSKGIFSAPSGSPQTVPTAIPMPRFNLLLIHISEAIGDFLEGGGSPFDGHVLYQEVYNRLSMLQGVTLVPDDVQLVLERIEPSDLTQVALAAVS